jgi:hypothetical protein
LIDLLRCCRFGKSKIFALIHFLIKKAGAYPAERQKHLTRLLRNSLPAGKRFCVQCKRLTYFSVTTVTIYFATQKTSL